MLEDLKSDVCAANLELNRSGLVTLTWGNVSGIDRDSGLVVIKPSGVSYAELTPEKMAVVDLDGNAVEDGLNPSSDTPTHVALYKAFPGIGGISHTHSDCATMYAQSLREIPCMGTTHADHFNGSVPVTRPLSEAEVKDAYEANTGVVIIERFAGIDPLEMPAVLVAHHGPFTWGRDAHGSVTNSIALETVARMAQGTELLNPELAPFPDFLLKKHFSRKHGTNAYYGQ